MRPLSNLFHGTAASMLPLPTARLRVLIVEDNADLARMFVWLVESCGFEVKNVLSGDLALDAARSFQPHFILLDIGLPGLDGYQVAELIRSDPTLNKVVIIAVSAYGPESHLERARKALFDHRLIKPVQLSDLLPLLSPLRD